MEHSISYLNLSVEPFEVEHILDLKICQDINEHGTLYFKALISENKKDVYIKGTDNHVSVRVDGFEGKNFTIFQGLVQNAEVKFSEGSYYLEVYAITFSYVMDTNLVSRTFQNKGMSYDSLIQYVMEDLEDASILDLASNGKSIGRLLVQYNETDWEFLKRLASHFHTGIVCDVRYDSLKCYFGMPCNNEIELETVDHSVKRDVKRYMMLSQNGVDGLRESDFIFYQVKSEKPANLGDKVHYKGQDWYVTKSVANMEMGFLIYDLTITTKNGMSQLFRNNEKIVGASLSASVDEIQNDRVKVSIEIDEIAGNTKCGKCFFPYSTIYSSQDGSGWYCMPEIGDHVRIYFPDGTEDHGYAISSIHEDVCLPDGFSDGTNSSDNDAGSGSAGGSYSGKRDDPSVKSLRNQDGKEIRLAPEGIYIIADGTTITLTDEGGVSIVSDQNIEFKSDHNIILCAQEDVNVIGTTGVNLSCNEMASVKIEENVEVIGQEVKAN